MDVLEFVALFVGLCLVVALPLVVLLRWAEAVSARRERRAGNRSLGERTEPGVRVVGQPT